LIPFEGLNEVKPQISLFLPAFNEEGNIARMVDSGVKALSELCDVFEVIIVNDGSHDATGRIADELAGKNDRIRVVHHNINRGYGAALRSGYAAARFDYVFFTDSDGQFEVGELKEFIPYIAEYPIVTGYRIERRDPFIRTLNARGWNLINRLLFGIRVKDINCAFKCVQKGVFEKIHLTTDGAMINAELYAKALAHGLKIKEIGVNHYPRRVGKQTGANIWVIARAFIELLRIKRSLRRATSGKTFDAISR
jgi:glycosyltransferase involved in cell wall biosynthesis